MADARERKNLRQVKRLDPDASGILASAVFVAVYAYNEADMEWEREDIEGPVFVTERQGAPAHSLVVVNRASSSNFLQYIGEGFEYDLTDGYIMFRCDAGVYSLWFNKEDERKLIVAALEKIAASADGGGVKQDKPNEDMPELLKDMFQQAASTSASNGGSSTPAKNASEEAPPASFTGPQAAANFTLSKEQMKDVLLRLVHTDKFIDILHNQYLKTQANAQPRPPQQQQPPQQHQQTMHMQHQQHQPQHQHMSPLASSPLRQPYGGMPHPSMYGSPMMYGGHGGPPPHQQSHHHHPHGQPPQYHQMAPSPGPNPSAPHAGTGQVGARLEPAPPHQHPHQQ